MEMISTEMEEIEIPLVMKTKIMVMILAILTIRHNPIVAALSMTERQKIEGIISVIPEVGVTIRTRYLLGDPAPRLWIE